MPPKPPGVAALASKFGGAPPCTACGKSCYANEQVKHNEKVFHEGCFCCKVCSSRIVAIGQATEYQGQIYHKACLSKTLKPPLLSPPGSAVPLARQPSSEEASVPPPRSPHLAPSHESSSPLRASGPPARPPPSPPTLDIRSGSSYVARTSEVFSSSPRSPTLAPRTLERAIVEDPKTPALQAKLAEMEAALEKERAKVRSLEGSLSSRSMDAPSSSAELDSLKAENAQLRASLKERTVDEARLKHELESMTQQSFRQETEHIKQLEALKNELKAKSKELDAKIAESEAKTTSMGTLSSELQMRTSMLEKLTADNRVLLEDLKLFESEVTSLTEKNQVLQEQLDQQQNHARESMPAEPPKANAPPVDSKLLGEMATGHSFTSYCIDPAHPHTQATQQRVLVFYEPNGAPEGHKGWICWSNAGTRQMSLEHRIAVNRFTQLVSKNSRTPFRSSRAQPQCCFSLVGADEDNVLDLEAESELMASKWMEGLKFLLKSSREEIGTMLGADLQYDNETLEQKQRMEELQKLELVLMHEVEQLKVRKQALLDAEPIDDSDTY